MLESADRWTVKWDPWHAATAGAGMSKPQPRDLPPVLVNPASLGHSRARSSTRCSGAAFALRSELRSWERDRVTHRACSIYYLSLYRTGVPALLKGELRVTLGRSLPPWSPLLPLWNERCKPDSPLNSPLLVH